MAHTNLGNPEAALADFSQAIEINPQDAKTYYNRGTVYDDLGNAKQAIADYTQFLMLHPAEDERSAHARERIEELGGEVP